MSNEDKDKSPEELRRELAEKVRQFTGASKAKTDSDASDANKDASDAKTSQDDAHSQQETKNQEQQRHYYNNSDADDTHHFYKNDNRGPRGSAGGFMDKIKKALEEAERQARAKQAQSGGGSGGSSSGNFPVKGLLGIAGAALAGILLFNSFYTVNESSRGIVTRFGAYNSTTMPGLNFKIPFLDKVQVVNVQQVSDLRLDGTMLTRDENVVIATLTVQYRIVDPVSFLYKVDEPLKTLREATESSLRYVVGHMDMNDILTTGRSVVREDTRREIVKLITNYQTGIEVVDVNFQSARPPESVKEAFDDAIKAQEDEQRYIREAEAYMRSREPIARGQAQQIIAQAEGYARQVVAKAEGDRAFFDKLLPQFLAQPQIFKQRYYLDQMAQLYASTPKVILEEGVNLNFLSLDKLLSNNATSGANNLTLPNSSKGGINYTPSNSDAPATPAPTQPTTPVTPSNEHSNSDSQTPSRFSGNRVGGN